MGTTASTPKLDAAERDEAVLNAIKRSVAERWLGGSDSDYLPMREGATAVYDSVSESATLVGWLHPQSRRFIYSDEKEHQPDRHKGYTIPVFALPGGEPT